MGETQRHIDLVHLIVRYVEWRLRAFPAVAIFADLPTTPRREKPPRIGGFAPDVFGTDVPTTIQVIGEAKTRDDLELPHTFLQLTAFLHHLRVRGGVLVVAVPGGSIVTARRLVHRLAVLTGAEGVERTILDDILPWR